MESGNSTAIWVAVEQAIALSGSVRRALRERVPEVVESVHRRSSRTAARYARTGSFNRRQLSTTERIFAILGPVCELTLCIQFFRPRATGRIEFLRQVVVQLQFRVLQNRVRRSHRMSVYLHVLASAPPRSATQCAADLLTDHIQQWSRLLRHPDSAILRQAKAEYAKLA